MPDTRLLYIHDPMCSWCYAFSRCLSELDNDLPADIRIVHLLGGLAPDTREPMPQTMRSAIQNTWQRIQRLVPGVRFNYDFWLVNTPIRSTYPACRALLAARKQGSEFEPLLLQAIQTAYYQQAKNPSLQATLEQCAMAVGLDTAVFVNDLASPTTDAQLQVEIQTARSMDVSSYPSLRLLHEAQQFTISVDYLDHRTMIRQITEILNNFPSDAAQPT